MAEPCACAGCQVFFQPEHSQQKYCSGRCYELYARNSTEHFAPWLDDVPEMSAEEYEIVMLAEDHESEETCRAADAVVARRALLVRQAAAAWHAANAETVKSEDGVEWDEVWEPIGE